MTTYKARTSSTVLWLVALCVSSGVLFGLGVKAKQACAGALSVHTTELQKALASTP